MQKQTAPDAQAGIAALRNIARHTLLTGAWLSRAENVAFAKGALNMLKMVERDGGVGAANFHASKGGYLPSALFDAAWAALPIGIEKFTMAQVQEFLTAHGVKLATDDIAHGDLDVVEQLKHSETALFESDDEHHPARADLSDGASSHVDPSKVEVPAIVAEGGTA